MKHILCICLLLSFFFQSEAQHSVAFSAQGLLTTSSNYFPQNDKPLDTTLPFLGLGAGVHYDYDLTEKTEIGIAATFAQRGYRIETTAGTKFGDKYNYLGLSPQLTNRIIPKLSARLAVPINYLASYRNFDNANNEWAKPSQFLIDEDIYNDFDIALQPSVLLHITEKLAVRLDVYYGLTPVTDVELTGLNGEVLESIKNRNIGIALGLEHRLF